MNLANVTKNIIRDLQHHAQTVPVGNKPQESEVQYSIYRSLTNEYSQVSREINHIVTKC